MLESWTTEIYTKIRSDRRMKVILFLLPIAILACLLALKLVRPGLYSRYVMHEDGPVENLQAVFFLVSSVLCLLCWRLSRDRHSGLVSIGFLSAAAMFFFVFGEEISWGQRILGFATPEGLTSINRQDELSLHNLNAVQDKLIYGTLSVSFLGSFGWAILAVLPERARDRLAEIGISRFIPDWYLSLYFLILFVVFLALTFLQGPLIDLFGDTLRRSGPYLKSRDQEAVELIFSLGISLFAFLSWARLKSEARAPDS